MSNNFLICSIQIYCKISRDRHLKHEMWDDFPDQIPLVYDTLYCRENLLQTTFKLLEVVRYKPLIFNEFDMVPCLHVPMWNLWHNGFNLCQTTFEFVAFKWTAKFLKIVIYIDDGGHNFYHKVHSTTFLKSKHCGGIVAGRHHPCKQLITFSTKFPIEKSSANATNKQFTLRAV